MGQRAMIREGNALLVAVIRKHIEALSVNKKTAHITAV